MWISKEKYLALVRRIERLEYQVSVMKNAGLPSYDKRGLCIGNVPNSELLRKILDHLGLKLEGQRTETTTNLVPGKLDAPYHPNEGD